MFEKVGDRAKRGLQRKGGPGVLPWKLKQKKHYGLCNQSYSGALLVNKISLVFLQSIKVILTLFFMPTILFTNIDADLCNSSENLILYLCIQANTNKLEKTQEGTLRFCSQ